LPDFHRPVQGQLTGGQLAAPQAMHLRGKRSRPAQRLQTQGVAGRRRRQVVAGKRFQGWGCFVSHQAMRHGTRSGFKWLRAKG
jgi:hypothetical protein